MSRALLFFFFLLEQNNEDQIFTTNLLRAVVDRINTDYSNGYPDIHLSDLPLRTRLEEEDEPNYSDITVDDSPMIPSLRDSEYLQHSSLWSHHDMTGDYSYEFCHCHNLHFSCVGHR